jgi:hypothetical protein
LQGRRPAGSRRVAAVEDIKDLAAHAARHARDGLDRARIVLYEPTPAFRARRTRSAKRSCLGVFAVSLQARF